jgi:hypothetical protein
MRARISILSSSRRSGCSPRRQHACERFGFGAAVVSFQDKTTLDRLGRADARDMSSPYISIGMPAFNSERTIAFALDGLLAQSFSDFELIVSDNASTDSTLAIVEDYARRDSRVVLLRQKENIGVGRNYSAVFRATRAKYFKWSSSSDWCAPGLLARCVAYLDAHPDTVVAAPRTAIFRQTPGDAVDYEHDIAAPQSDPVARFLHVCNSIKLNNVMNGLIRSESLRGTRLIEPYPSADMVMVAHLALLGKFALLDDRMLFRRMVPETATLLMSREAALRYHFPQRTIQSQLSTWRLMGGYMQAVRGTQLPPNEAVRALAWVVRMAYWKRAEMGRDLIRLAGYFMSRETYTTAPR